MEELAPAEGMLDTVTLGALEGTLALAEDTEDVGTAPLAADADT